ncbi:glycosyltransferase [Roseomonas sp. HF4]|uniref:glycosyltransferase n=1 Tax=Roseomonas sp. HF4 TaxID=2562313 RepID=UPI0010C0F8C8|nr:glycosyltransferase [Roseomonas sp. HF4]
MRVAFFGLDFHARTGSSRFLLDLLEGHATVDAIFAAPDVAAVRRAAPGFDEGAYDAIFVWQLHEAFALLSGRHPNVTFAPMYDAMWRGGAFTWKPSFNAAKILCFSWALRTEVMRRAPVHAQVQYFPDPAEHPPVEDFDTLRGFLWYRRREIPPEATFALTEGTRFESLSIHDAPDPGHEAPFPAAAPPHLGRLVRTAWSADGQAFRDALAGANVFFAPRPLEGIGMSFLEAMARGLCVAAPDAPTMNEYISHGGNGLLYAPGRLAPIDFAAAREIGARARESIARGRARWEAWLPALVEFIATPTARIAARGAIVATPDGVAVADADITVVPPDQAADPPRGEWLIVAPRGLPQDAGAWRRAIAAAPPDAGIVRGHHIDNAADGAETFHRADAFPAGWARMLVGDVAAEGPRGLGVPEATLVRGTVLRRLGGPLPTTAPALAALLLKAAKADVTVHDTDGILGRRRRPADAAAERAAWIALVAREDGAAAADRLRGAFARAAAAETLRHRATAAARAATGLIAALDRLSPALGRRLEALVLGGGMRRLRGLLRR